jgi:hypothetical protein
MSRETENQMAVIEIFTNFSGMEERRCWPEEFPTTAAQRRKDVQKEFTVPAEHTGGCRRESLRRFPAVENPTRPIETNQDRVQQMQGFPSMREPAGYVLGLFAMIYSSSRSQIAAVAHVVKCVLFFRSATHRHKLSVDRSRLLISSAS